MNVDQLMSKPVCSVEPETTLAEATTVMGERHVGSALILEGDTLVGILTERDVVRAMSTAFDAPMRPVIEWMTKRPTTTGPETPVKEALRIMVDGGFRHLPIVQDDQVVGIVSMRDIARALAD
ncbi:MAG TPA: CBS domain-containing protein [Actinomycetota bacterium]|nr:CBS domain-containing protein [Actinomycetota bacterium]